MNGYMIAQEREGLVSVLKVRAEKRGLVCIENQRKNSEETKERRRWTAK
jgi:hypothetical protein